MQKIGRPESGTTVAQIAAEWWSLTTNVDYLKAGVSRRDLWWLLLPLPYLVDALANREVTDVVILDSCAASVLLMASCLTSEMIWADFVIAAVEASRMVIGNIIVPGAWSPFAAPSLMICFSMACAGVHSSALATFALVAAMADLFAASPGFEEAAVMHALACAYVVACAAIMEHRVCGQLVGPAAGGSGYRQLQLPSFGHYPTASRTLGGEVYYPVHDDPAMSRNTADPLIVSDCEESVPALAHPELPGGPAFSSPSRALGPEHDQQDEEQGYVVSPSPGSVASSPRALDSASPAAAELLVSEQQMAEAEASWLRSPERGDLKGALSSMLEMVQSLDHGSLDHGYSRQGARIFDSRQDLTYDDELQVASRTDDPAGASPSMILAVSSPPQPTSPVAGLQAVKLDGFKTEAFNDLFVENPSAQFNVNGQSTWWSEKGWFLFYSPHSRTWGIARASRLDRVRAGQSQPHARSPEGYDLLRGAALEPPMGWKEWDAEAGEWVNRPGSGLRSRGRVQPRPLDGARSPGAPERGRPHRPEVNRSPQPVHLATGSSPERPSPPLPPPAEPPTADMHFGSYGPRSPPHTPNRVPDSPERLGSGSWRGRAAASPHGTGLSAR